MPLMGTRIVKVYGVAINNWSKISRIIFKEKLILNYFDHNENYTAQKKNKGTLFNQSLASS